MRHVFFISDGTGITAETLGAALLSQFEGQPFRSHTLPFINTLERALSTVSYINHLASSSEQRPIVFSTTIGVDIRAQLQQANALFLDLFDAFLSPIQGELATEAALKTGKAHGLGNREQYNARIAAMNYAMEHDDGQSVRDLAKADVILIAPSRCGKTPTSLYLALQYSIFATNFPLTEEELNSATLPKSLKGLESKLYGLTSDPERLSQVRSERRSGSKYASLAQCAFELRQAESLYRRHRVMFMNTANSSIEEIAATIMQDKALRR